MVIRKNIRKKISAFFVVAIISMVALPFGSANAYAAEDLTPNEATEVQNVELEEPPTVIADDTLITDDEQQTGDSADKDESLNVETETSDPSNDEKTDEEIPSVPAIREDDDGDPSSEDPDVVTATSVATVYIISYKGSSGSSWSSQGHTCLAVRNDSDSTITIGHYNLSAGSIMTVGSWGNISDGKYAYYNIEKYRMVNNIFAYSLSVYYKVSVTLSQIDKLTTAINNNYTWSETKNCARFARYCWNCMFSSTSAYHIPASSTVETPTQMYSKISNMSGYSTNFKFGSSRWCTMDYVYRHTSGGKASLSSAAQRDVKMGG